MRSPRKRRTGPVGYGCALVLLAGQVLAGDMEARPQAAAPMAGSVRFLDIRRPSLSQRLEVQGRDVGRSRFVQIKVVEVRNPRRTGVTFDVNFHADGGATTHLGSFSLYPADNPGTFIVPFRRVTLPGSVSVSFHATDRIDPAAPPVIGIGAIDLIDVRGTTRRPASSARQL